jgi:hypothetical protein
MIVQQYFIRSRRVIGNMSRCVGGYIVSTKMQKCLFLACTCGYPEHSRWGSSGIRMFLCWPNNRRADEAVQEVDDDGTGWARSCYGVEG